MKGSDLGRGFSWPALQERGLDYQQERDQPAIEAAKERSTLSRSETIPTSTPERGLVDFTKDIGRTAGQYLLDQANPVRKMDSHIQTLQQISRGVSDGISALREMTAKQPEMESLQRSAGLDPSGRDGIAQLQQTAGIEPAKEGRDALEELSKIAGLDRPCETDPTHTFDDALTQTPCAPAMEVAVEEHSLDLAIELIL